MSPYSGRPSMSKVPNLFYSVSRVSMRTKRKKKIAQLDLRVGLIFGKCKMSAPIWDLSEVYTLPASLRITHPPIFVFYSLGLQTD